MNDIDHGRMPARRTWENLRPGTLKPASTSVGRSGWISGVAGAALIGYGLGRRRLRAAAPAARHRAAAPRRDGPLRDQPRTRAGIRRRARAGRARREPGPGRRHADRAVGRDRPAARRAVPLLAAARQPAALHGQSRIGDRAGQPAVPLGREGPCGHAGRVGRGDPQRDRGRAHRLALAAGLGGRPGGLGALHAGRRTGGPRSAWSCGTRRPPARWATRWPTCSATTPSSRSRTICAGSSRSWRHGGRRLHAEPGHALTYDCIIVGGGAGRAERGTDARPLPPPRARVRYRRAAEPLVARGARLPHARRHRTRRAAADGPRGAGAVRHRGAAIGARGRGRDARASGLPGPVRGRRASSPTRKLLLATGVVDEIPRDRRARGALRTERAPLPVLRRLGVARSADRGLRPRATQAPGWRSA